MERPECRRLLQDVQEPAELTHLRLSAVSWDHPADRWILLHVRSWSQGSALTSAAFVYIRMQMPRSRRGLLERKHIRRALTSRLAIPHSLRAHRVPIASWLMSWR